jgi:hypothetical protein
MAVTISDKSLQSKNERKQKMKKTLKTITASILVMLAITVLVACGTQDDGFVPPLPPHQGSEPGQQNDDINGGVQDNSGNIDRDENEPTLDGIQDGGMGLDLGAPDYDSGYEIFENYQEPAIITDGMRKALERAEFYLDLTEDEYGWTTGIGVSMLGLYRGLSMDHSDEEALWATIQRKDADWNAQALFSLISTRDFLDSIDFDYESSFMGGEQEYLRNMLLVGEFRISEIDYAMSRLIS